MKMNEYEQKNITDWFNLFTRMKYNAKVMIYLGKAAETNIIPSGIFVYGEYRDEEIKKAYYNGTVGEMTYLNFCDLLDYNIDLIIPMKDVLVISAVKNIKPYSDENYV